MTHPTKTLVLATLPALVLFATGKPFAQPMGVPPGRMYDPATVETVRGKVTAIDPQATRPGGGPGVHLRLETAAGPLAVRLGPAWYLEEQKLTLKVDDEIQIIGSRIIAGDEPTLIAAEVKKGDRVVKLRDASGIPLWRGRGGGPPR
jgi:hypothetical protein